METVHLNVRLFERVPQKDKITANLNKILFITKEK